MDSPLSLSLQELLIQDIFQDLTKLTKFAQAKIEGKLNQVILDLIDQRYIDISADKCLLKRELEGLQKYPSIASYYPLIRTNPECFYEMCEHQDHAGCYQNIVIDPNYVNYSFSEAITIKLLCQFCERITTDLTLINKRLPLKHLNYGYKTDQLLDNSKIIYSVVQKKHKLGYTDFSKPLKYKYLTKIVDQIYESYKKYDRHPPPIQLTEIERVLNIISDANGDESCHLLLSYIEQKFNPYFLADIFLTVNCYKQGNVMVTGELIKLVILDYFNLLQASSRPLYPLIWYFDQVINGKFTKLCIGNGHYEKYIKFYEYISQQIYPPELI